MHVMFMIRTSLECLSRKPNVHQMQLSNNRIWGNSWSRDFLFYSDSWEFELEALGTLIFNLPTFITNLQFSIFSCQSPNLKLQSSPFPSFHTKEEWMNYTSPNLKPFTWYKTEYRSWPYIDCSEQQKRFHKEVFFLLSLKYSKA